MKLGTKQILNILYILSWILFVGLCIEGGGFIVNAFFALAKPGIVKHLWHEADLSTLFNYHHGYYFVVTLISGITSVLKAWLFYLIIKILHDRKFNLIRPFTPEAGRFIFGISYVTLGIGLFSWYGVRYTEWLMTQGVQMPGIQILRIGGADVWLFMSVTLFVIAQVFKRGIEIQSDNELTV